MILKRCIHSEEIMKMERTLHWTKNANSSKKLQLLVLRLSLSAGTRGWARRRSSSSGNEELRRWKSLQTTMEGFFCQFFFSYRAMKVFAGSHSQTKNYCIFLLLMPNFDGCGFYHPHPSTRIRSSIALVLHLEQIHSSLPSCIWMFFCTDEDLPLPLLKNHIQFHTDSFYQPRPNERIGFWAIRGSERERELTKRKGVIIIGGNAAAIPEKCRWPFSYINRQATTSGRLNEPSNCRSKPQILNRKPRISCLCPEFAMKSLSWSPSWLPFLAIGLGKQGALQMGRSRRRRDA